MLGLQDDSLDATFVSRLQRAAALAAKDGPAFDAGLTIAQLAPDAAQKMANDLPCQEEPVLDYVTDAETRLGLLKTFKAKMAKGKMPVVERHTLAAVFMAVPLETLRHFLDTNTNEANEDNYYQMRGLLAEAWVEVLPLFLSRGGAEKRLSQAAGSSTTTATTQRLGGNPDASPSSGGTSSSVRSRTAARLARDRDSNSCLIMGTPHPEAAHIFPFSASKNPARRSRLGLLLRIFWPADAAEWQRLYSDGQVTESPQNRLCLNHQLRHWWREALFGLKPLRQSADGCALDVQFHWLRPLQFGDSDAPGSDAAFAASIRHPGWGPSLAHRRSGLPIQTGQVFTLRARIPSELPNFGLLQVQWHFLRIAAMAGGAEAIEAEAEKRRRKQKRAVEYLARLFEHRGAEDDWSSIDEYDDDDGDDLEQEAKDVHEGMQATIEGWLGGTDDAVPDPNTS